MKKKKKNRKGSILPVVAAALVVIALIVVFASPKKGGGAADSLEGELTEDGELLIRADSLSADQVSFIQVPGDSRIELVARLGDDGTAKVALGTCQSCNGSPGAYYTQEGDELVCNNCGLTFPLTVLDSPGGGCHPIMLDEQVLNTQDADVLVDTDALSAYESLFASVAEH